MVKVRLVFEVFNDLQGRNSPQRYELDDEATMRCFPELLRIQRGAVGGSETAQAPHNAPPVRRTPPRQPTVGNSQADIAERVLRDIGHPLTPSDLLAFMETEQNYVTVARDPISSLNSALYRKPDIFKYVDGRWHLIERDDFRPTETPLSELLKGE